MSKRLTPSTIDGGFILTTPALESPATSDHVFQRILQWHLPQDVIGKIAPELRLFGSDAISANINSLIANAESQQPYVKAHNVWGARYESNGLVTSTGWKELGKWGIKNGVVGLGYEDEFGPYRRTVQHAFNYLFSASSAAFSCPVSMTSGAARLVRHQIFDLPKDHPFHELYAKLIARENNWISAQWMTERPGGSDVRNSETIATYSPLASKTGRFGNMEEGDYVLSGFKFFCSATDCDVVLLLAKTESGELSLFVAPTTKTVTDASGKTKKVSNGIRIHRLKNKMGTKELPTAEVELREVRAHLIGPKDRGIATIALLLNTTRTHNFITALSCLRRAIDIAKAFARARTTIDQPLWTFPMHLNMLSQLEVKHRGWMQLAFFTSSLLSYVDNGFPVGIPDVYSVLVGSPSTATVVLRAFTSTSKAVICKSATLAFQECQEAMGGVGYIDEPDEPEFNVSRLWRDTASNSVWEGTTNVLASETVRHLTKGQNLDLFHNWISNAISQIRDLAFKTTLQDIWLALKSKLEAGRDEKGLGGVLGVGRQIIFTLSWLVSGMLLCLDAQRDNDSVAREVARRWVLDGQGVSGEFAFNDLIYQRSALAQDRKPTDRERTEWDCRIVWGVDLPPNASPGYRMAKI
ncbi:acyl-CoA dehydrogenase [Penicillium brasilianum]|uniref:Acyl-CoA dehydrogenase n=1 Tax=Penicillium brasilianum TaxID=104259 RepID=A0A1S9RKE9_PENBI|nr:acyl-CoA dehydrogenase [Penicillium brasilianum]